MNEETTANSDPEGDWYKALAQQLQAQQLQASWLEQYPEVDEDKRVARQAARDFAKHTTADY
jgi:hypothetical protein